MKRRTFAVIVVAIVLLIASDNVGEDNWPAAKISSLRADVSTCFAEKAREFQRDKGADADLPDDVKGAWEEACPLSKPLPDQNLQN